MSHLHVQDSSELHPTPGTPNAWSPLRRPPFRSIWLAVVISNTGTWMQTVGAQLMLVDEPRASALVALVQTASTLPVVILAMPAGVLADTFDRRLLLIGIQIYLATAALAMALLAATGEMRPPLLLMLTFALGVGAALTWPTYQALIPDLVPRTELSSASALGAVSMNVARAVGPGIAGIVITRIGTAAVFAINAATFVIFTVVLLTWRPERVPVAYGRERFAPALRAGGRFVRHSPVIRRLVLRSVLFVAPAMAPWALLPIVATERLGLGPSGYGLLLGALGLGAVGGAVTMPRLRLWLAPSGLIGLSSVVFACSTAVVGVVREVPFVIAALLPAGACWVVVLSTINATLQSHLPSWVRARGLAVYQMAIFGAQALAAALWGVISDMASVAVSLTSAACVMAIGALSIRWWPTLNPPERGRESATYWKQPQLLVEPEPSVGPIMVELAYSVPPEDRPGFVLAMERVRRSRQRSGAYWWQLFQDGEQPARFVEVYLVRSWGEHLRQHDGRLTETDAAIEREARAFSRSAPEVRHLLPPAR